MLALLIALTVLLTLFYLTFLRRSPDPTTTSPSPSALTSRPTRAQRLISEAFEFSPTSPPASGPFLNVLVLYATEYGFAKEVARRACRTLQRALRGALRVRVLNVLDYACADLRREDAVMLVASTTGDGVPPNEAADFRDALEADRLRLARAPVYAVLALGDKAYPHFCRGGRILAALLENAAHAPPAVEIGLVDQEDLEVVDAWVARFVDAVTAAAESRWDGGDEIVPAAREERVERGRARGEEDGDYLRKAVEKYAASLDEATVRYSRNDPYPATVKCKEELTKRDSVARGQEKCVIRVDFDVSNSSLSYTVGDALGVVPLNNVDAVERMLQALAAVGDEPVVAGGAMDTLLAEPVPFRDALTSQLDLRTVRPELIAALGAASDDEEARVRAASLVDASGTHFTEAGATYAEPRHVIDVLGDFASAALTPPEVARLLRPLTARYYSISSTPAVCRNTVAVTVDVLRYQSLNTAREGVASTFLCDRVTVGGDGTRVGIFVSRNDNFRLPKSPSVPVIMIGPGTGIAPFVGFLDERVESAATGRNVLFFGCRHAAQDFLYREKLESLVADGALELETAFSRDQPHKIYVQDRIRARGRDLWSLIDGEGAHTYVCGDGRHMAQDVDEALRQVFQEHGKMTESAAASYLSSLADQGRMQRDVWVP